MSKKQAGALRLLEMEDERITNFYNQPLVGWYPTTEGAGGLINPRGYAMQRTVMQKEMAGKMVDLYDQPTIIENAGAIVVAQAGNKIGLVQNFRMVGDRITTRGNNYVKSLDDEWRWPELMRSLGEWRWELPAGLAVPTEQTGVLDLEQIVLKAAHIESIEEAGLTIGNSRIIGRVNSNPTFFPHAQYVVHATIVSQGKQAAEDLEILGKAQLFTPKQIRDLITAGEFDDAKSIAALALAGIQIPL